MPDTFSRFYIFMDTSVDDKDGAAPINQKQKFLPTNFQDYLNLPIN
jgi:hypothetical protein